MHVPSHRKVSTALMVAINGYFEIDSILSRVCPQSQCGIFRLDSQLE